ncbi:6-bladed beta-propeller [Algoriphagus sp. C2-6-M1]|uniref:6-bladed beta-propeller n=1 Tax=Algoriphagus persicinus TaxID=3108754 RepID=UPI002B3732EA|nr:6-bladed beta-propeller [Algoriphagus sp. C2-6-M1]MEB2781677.1 6-bladed beta-propeller [Algoriphagus sp. C2-6-M1]
MYKSLFLSTLLYFLFSCESEIKVTNESSIPIPVPNNTEELLSSFISKIEYFSFPKEASVVKIDKAQIFDDKYFFADYEISQTISILNTDMSFVANIQKYGEGPGEYLAIHDFTINRDNKTIDILSFRKLIRYDYQGNFIDEFKLPGVITKIQHINKNTYMAYRPSAINKDLVGPDNISILWTWNVITNEIIRIPSPVEDVKIPFFTERNNLNFQDGKILFSTNFLDTIYTYSENGEIIRKHFFDGDKEYLPFDVLTNTKGVLSPEQRKKFYYHHANLLEDKNHIVTRIINDGLFSNIIYYKEKKESIIFSELTNDIDDGYKWIMPVILKDGFIISTIEAPYLVEHFENGNFKEDSHFYDFAKDLTINSPVVLTKYYLKK